MSNTDESDNVTDTTVAVKYLGFATNSSIVSTLVKKIGKIINSSYSTTIFIIKIESYLHYLKLKHFCSYHYIKSIQNRHNNIKNKNPGINSCTTPRCCSRCGHLYCGESVDSLPSQHCWPSIKYYMYENMDIDTMFTGVESHNIKTLNDEEFRSFVSEINNIIQSKYYKANVPESFLNDFIKMISY